MISSDCNQFASLGPSPPSPHDQKIQIKVRNYILITSTHSTLYTHIHTHTTKVIFHIVADLVHAHIIVADLTSDSIIVADFIADFSFTVLPMNRVMVPSD